MAFSGRQHVVLIDPVLTGDGFLRACHQRGFAVTAVYTLGAEVLDAVARERRNGTHAVVHASSVADILALVERPVHAVVAATEPGVALADGVAHALGLPGNDPATAPARRYKDAMRNHARAVGLPVPRFEVVPGGSEAARPDALFLAAQRIGFPAIIKPTSGAAAHGVQVLRNADDARRLLGSPQSRDIFGHRISGWVVEEYLSGRELAVNCFSDGVEHHVLDIWEYQQPVEGPYDQPYWNLIQITAEDADWAGVVRAVQQILTEFGVCIGPSHTEVKVTADGVRLIEVGARLPGARMTDHWAQHSGFDAYDETVSAFLDPASLTTRDKLPHFDARLGICCLRNDGLEGRLESLRGADAVAGIPQVDALHLNYQVGDRVPVTTDLNSLFGKALVSADTVEDLLRVHENVRKTIEMEISTHG
ncbi:ATP-grasp domain-containing protein [Nocardioides jensenii]|uniref:ATP-grasp domain-containing protein n=1 Tax=Nocardioides jensenii TaxID=1843 RepID=UPI000831DD77|nr:ATP-grasp domain-containing protein [Nocardioides jensenii]